MKLGKPKDFQSNIQVRLRAIERAVAQYQFSSSELKKSFQDKIVPGTTLFLKGLGTEINLLSCFKEIFFNSRELLDALLFFLNQDSKGENPQIPRKFLPFAKNLMNGDYDNLNLSIIDFLKLNITYIFQIRRIRNELKSNPANIEFRYNTNRFESFCRIPIKNEEKELIQYLDIINKDEALKKSSYGCTYNLDELFPEMLEFCRSFLAIYEKDKKSLTRQSS